MKGKVYGIEELNSEKAGYASNIYQLQAYFNYIASAYDDDRQRIRKMLRVCYCADSMLKPYSVIMGVVNVDGQQVNPYLDRTEKLKRAIRSIPIQDKSRRAEKEELIFQWWSEIIMLEHRMNLLIDRKVRAELD